MSERVASNRTADGRNRDQFSTAQVLQPGRSHNLPVATRFPRSLLAIGVLGFAGLLAGFWIAFAVNGETAFMLTAATLFFAIYIGLPFAMSRTADRHGHDASNSQSLHDFLVGEFDTFTGRISGWAAAVQYAFLPVALALGGLAIGLIMMIQR